MLNVIRYNWERGVNERVPANEDAVQELLDFFYGSKAWMDNPEAVNRKVRKLKERIYPGSDTPAIGEWEGTVRTYVRTKPQYWTTARLVAALKRTPEEIEPIRSAVLAEQAQAVA